MSTKVDRYRERLSAIALAALMITSVLAVGGAAAFDPGAETLTRTGSAGGPGALAAEADDSTNGTADGDDGIWAQNESDTGGSSPGVQPASHTSGTAIGAFVTRPQLGSGVTYGSNETVRIWVGARNQSTIPETPLTNYSVSVEIRYPNGTVADTRTVTTGESGNTIVEFDLQGHPDGIYRAFFRASGAQNTSLAFQAGPSLTLYPRSFGNRPITVGRNVTVAVQAMSGFQPAANTTVRVSVSFFNSTTQLPITQTTVRTDANGYARVSFTPNFEGSYQVSATNISKGISAFATYKTLSRAAQVTIPNQYDLADGETARIGGRVLSGTSAYANQNLTVRIIRDDASDSIVANLTTTTDAQGLFAVEWPTPVRNDRTDYDVKLLTSGGETITILQRFGTTQTVGFETEPRRVRRSVSTDARGPRGIRFSAFFDDFETTPGGTANGSVILTENGSAIPGKDVTIQLAYRSDFGSAVPFKRISVTTDSNGRATFQAAVPTSAPSSNIRIRGRAVVTVKNQTRSSFLFGPDIRQFEVFNFPRDQPRTGQTHRFEFDVRNLTSGSPEPGVFTSVTTVSSGIHSTVIDTGSNVTGPTGGATVPVSVPADVSGMITHETRVLDRQGLPSSFAQGFDITVNAPGGNITAGENVTVRYSANASNVSAFVGVSTFRDLNETAPVGQIATPGENVTFEVPVAARKGTDFEVVVIAVNESGLIAAKETDFEVTEGAPLPDIRVSVPNQVFRTLPVGTNTSVPVTVSNVGQRTLTVDGTNITVTSGAGRFNLSNGGSFTLAPGASRTVTVRFTPMAPGRQRAELRFATNDPDAQTYIIEFAGVGRGPTNLAGFGNTTAPPASAVPSELANGTFRTESRVAGNTSVQVASSSNKNYSLAINVTGNATDVTFYLKASTVEAVVGNLVETRLLVDGTEQPFSVVTQNGTRYVAFTVANFSTRTVTFSSAATLGISGGTVTPATADELTTVTHNVGFEVSGLSKDGNTDVFYVTFPDAVRGTNLSANSANVTNLTDGSDISISSSVSKVDGPDNDSVIDTLRFAVSPTGSGTVTAVVNVSVDISWPAVQSATGFDIRASVVDSSTGSAGPTTVASVTVANTTSGAVTPGDVTGDGTVNTGDVIQVQRFIVNLRTLSSGQVQAADVTDDGTVNTGDVIQIQRFIVGLRASL